MDQNLTTKYIGWLKNEGHSENTVKVYLNGLNKLAGWFENTEGCQFEPAKVTTLHLHDFRAYMGANEKLEPATINKIIASLKTFYKFALEMDIVSYNPTIKIKMKRTMKQYAAPKWLSKLDSAKFFHEIEKVKNEKQKARDMAICRLMAGAGLRVQEVSDLAKGDICLENHRENVTIRGGRGDKLRTVPLNPDVIESLLEWLKFRGDINSGEPLFITERNTQMGVRSIHYMVVKYANMGKLNDVSPHTLRHTFCKNLEDQGVPLQQIAYLAGHDSLETTRRYTEPGEKDLRESVQSISEKR
jgi:integrase/recombinase XerC